jgi:putative DNA primase/helicase
MTSTPAQIESIRQTTDIVALVRSSVKLTRKGDVFWGLCPFHGPENTASFKVDNIRRRFHCFACGADGDAFKWVQETEHLTFPEAVDWLSNGHAPKVKANGHAAPHKPPRPTPTAIMPVPADAPAPVFEHPRHGKPSQTWTYMGSAGEPLAYVARFDTAEGKEIIPRVYTATGWRWQGLPKPRPLYGLDRLAARPDAPVVVVEGEKCADAAVTLCPNHVVVTWCGGVGAVEYTDWAPLAGRNVMIWPDADDPGVKAAHAIRQILGKQAKTVMPPDDAAKGFDAADALAEGWDWPRVQDWLLRRRIGEPHVHRPKKEKKARGPIPESDSDGADPMQGEGLPAPLPEPEGWPFQVLGHYRGTHFYLPNSGGTIITLSASAHVPKNFYDLAPLNFWEAQFGCRERAGWEAAANALIQTSLRVGIYDQTRLRGRGAWWDDGRVVVHLGDRLVVDGIVTPIRQHKSDYFYEVGAKIKFASGQPLSNAEASKLLDLCKMLAWERPLSAYQLAGWIAGAPICGALKWRPHIFVSGVAGAGKSWIYQNIIVRAIGNAGWPLASSVTEPGIRRVLGSDALPVMIDELEARDERGVQRVEGIMGLMRYSSSETDAIIVKGTQGGGGVDMFRIRSMFCILAIGSIIKDYADTTRISTLSLKAVAGAAGAERFARIESATRELLTDDWIDRLHSRIVGLIPVIRHNAEVFAVAGAQVLDTRRLGDQIGTQLALAYALTSIKQITPADAKAWLESQDWTEEREITQDTDGPMCLAKILEHQISVETAGRGSVKRTIGELIVLSRHTMYQTDEFISSDTAGSALKRHGIAPMKGDYEGFVAISNTHSAIGKILYDTPWASNWSRRLAVIPEALKHDKAIYFAGTVSRAVLVKV